MLLCMRVRLCRTSGPCAPSFPNGCPRCLRAVSSRYVYDDLSLEIVCMLMVLIKPNHVEVLPGGLAGIPEGLKRLEEGRVSAVKLVAHPQETA